MNPIIDQFGDYRPPYNPYMSNIPKQGTPDFVQTTPGQFQMPPGITGYQAQNATPNQPQQYPPLKGPPMPSGSAIPGPGGVTGPPAAGPTMPPKMYMENILTSNRGKIGTFYFTFQNNSQWNAKIIKGVLLAAGRDYIVIKEVNSEHRWLMPTLNFDFAVFDEPLEELLGSPLIEKLQQIKGNVSQQL